MDQLFDTKRAGELLGGLHANDVYRLIKDGRIVAKKMVVRGTGKLPRLYIARSEIERFIRELPATDEVRVKPTTQARRPRALAKELEGARQYY